MVLAWSGLPGNGRVRPGTKPVRFRFVADILGLLVAIEAIALAGGMACSPRRLCHGQNIPGDVS